VSRWLSGERTLAYALLALVFWVLGHGLVGR
jgi:hypothetical protein